MIEAFLKILQALFNNNERSEKLNTEVKLNTTEEIKIDSSIDWLDPKAKISRYFTVHDATYLPSWDAYHAPSEEEKQKILEVAGKMDLIREHLSDVVIVHAWTRPGKANCSGSQWNEKDYNRFVYETQVWKGLSEAEKATKKVPDSPHKYGNAVDWHLGGGISADDCAKVRARLLGKLQEFGIRMENRVGPWIHVDTRAVGPSGRFFIP